MIYKNEQTICSSFEIITNKQQQQQQQNCYIELFSRDR